MNLDTLSSGIQKRKLKKRVGRGMGSGHGKTGSRGHKGQYASAGANMPGPIFTGGQTPIHRTFPKRGFSNATWAKDYAVVNVGDLEILDVGTTVDMVALKASRLVVGTFDGVRILGDGDLTKKLAVSANHFSATAKAKIEALGGTATVIPKPKRPVRNKMGQGKRDQVRKAAEAKSKAKAAEAK